MGHRELARCAPPSTRLCRAHYEEPLMRNTVGYFRTGGKDPLARFVGEAWPLAGALGRALPGERRQKAVCFAYPSYLHTHFSPCDAFVSIWHSKYRGGQKETTEPA
jgi:hypothetical protein